MVTFPVVESVIQRDQPQSFQGHICSPLEALVKAVSPGPSHGTQLVGGCAGCT